MVNNVFSKRYNDLLEKSKNIELLTDDELLSLKIEAQEIHDEYENLQLVVKRNGNSLYGVSASQYFSLNDTDLAEDITVTAKHFAILIDKAITEFFNHWADNPNNLKTIQQFYPDVIKIENYILSKPENVDTSDALCVYGDTDSRYLRNDLIYPLMVTENGKKQLPIEDKELSEFTFFLSDNFINKVIKNSIDEECEKRNARKGYLKMAHEVTTRKCVFLKKKKYIMTVIQSDGKIFDHAKLKFKGVELKRGSMSEKAKKILGKLVDKYLLENYTTEQIRQECLKIIKYIKIKKDKDLIYQISSVSGLSDMKKNDAGIWYSDKNHIQMQMAISWNNFITQNKLTGLYKPAFEGQKMMYYYCEENSDYKVIAVPDDVDFADIENLPEPDWNKMIIQTLIKPLCRYILPKSEITDKDIEAFLLGVKIWNF